MRNKWVSCSTNRHLNFNADLLRFNQDLWDYVIVHELLHFFVPNHGRLWKSLMRVHLGEYETLEKRLSTLTHSQVADMPDRYDTSGTPEGQFQPGSDNNVLLNKLGIKDSQEMEDLKFDRLVQFQRELFDGLSMDQQITVNNLCD